MPTTNILANLFTTLYNTEDRKKAECIILPTSKLATKVLTVLKSQGYIGEFEHVNDNRGGKFKIQLLAKITKCGVVTTTFYLSFGTCIKLFEEKIKGFLLDSHYPQDE
jgi:small subunit ribosomal protein S8